MTSAPVVTYMLSKLLLIVITHGFFRDPHFATYDTHQSTRKILKAEILTNYKESLHHSQMLLSDRSGMGGVRNAFAHGPVLVIAFLASFYVHKSSKETCPRSVKEK